VVSSGSSSTSHGNLIACLPFIVGMRMRDGSTTTSCKK